MKSRKLLGMCIALILFASLLAACSPTPEPTIVEEEPTEVVVEPTAVVEEPTAEPEAGACPAEGGQLVVGLSWEPSKIDPHRTAAENGVLPVMQACETLVIHAASGGYEPYLAKSWEVSDDGLSYTFHLQEGVLFHDGTPFNAEAVKYNLDRIVDPNTQSEEAIGHLGPYESTEVVDENTAIVHLSSPFAALLDGLAVGWVCMVSPTAAQQWGTADFQDHFVGTGPFIFKEWKRNEYILLEKNPSYWGGPAYFKHHGNACLDSVIFKFVGEDAVRTGTLETGEIHGSPGSACRRRVERLKADPEHHRPGASVSRDRHHAPVQHEQAAHGRSPGTPGVGVWHRPKGYRRRPLPGPHVAGLWAAQPTSLPATGLARRRCTRTIRRRPRHCWSKRVGRTRMATASGRRTERN